MSYLFLFWVIRNKEIYLTVKCLPVQILNLLNIDVYQWFTWSSNVDFFADDAFLFPVMYDINASTIELSNDLKKILLSLPMSFNPESTKQAQETIFSRNLKRHHAIWFSITVMSLTLIAKNLGGSF